MTGLFLETLNLSKLPGGNEMANDNVICEIKGTTGYITLNRPATLNAIDRETVDRLVDALTQCKRDSACRAVIVAGAGGKAFSVGADINMFIDSRQEPFGGREWSRYGQAGMRVFDSLGKPSIAALNGLVMGGGLEIALACTFRIASENSQFGLPEIRVGIMPGWGGTQRLVQLIGRARAAELILTGTSIDSAEAYRIGLINRMVRPEKVLSACEGLANTIAQNAPLAVNLALEALGHAGNIPLEQGLLLESNLAGLLCLTEDADQGIKSFMERKKPVFNGR